MITSRKNSEINIFAGSPWEVESVKQMLKAAYIDVSTVDNGHNGIKLFVARHHYTAAVRVISNKLV